MSGTVSETHSQSLVMTVYPDFEVLIPAVGWKKLDRVQESP